MGLTAGLKLVTILDNVERIITIELMAAAQGIDFRKQALGDQAALGLGTKEAYHLIRQQVPFIEADTFMGDFIESIRLLIVNNTIIDGVNHVMGYENQI